MRGRWKAQKQPTAGVRRRIVSVLVAVALATAACATVLIVGLLWKPSGLRPEGPSPNLLKTVAASSIPSAAGALLADGRVTLSLGEATLEEILAAIVDRGNKSIPSPLASRVRARLPREIEQVARVTVTDAGVQVILKCRKSVTFYAGLTLIPRLATDGTLSFDIKDAAAGFLPLPQSIVNRAGGTLVVPSTREAGIRITQITTSAGLITLDLKTEGGGSQWLETLSAQ